MKNINNLLEEALKAKEMAYSPFSKFKVGAALKTKSGKIYTGCNIENASYGLTICAERTAIFKAVSEGEKDFVEIMIVTSNPDKLISPCGACRQVLAEFNKDIVICLEGKKVYSLTELLPDSFSGKDFM